MPKGEEHCMDKGALTIRQEKRTFNYIVLAMLAATIAAWIVWYPK
jgi:hypothetical protein